MIDNYRYMVVKHGNNLYKYNHALFENMKSFIDCSWEINLTEGTVIMLYESVFPDMVGKSCDYDGVIELYAREVVYYADRERFLRQLSRERLKTLKSEEILEVHFVGSGRLPEINRIILTPVTESDGNVNCVYLSAKNIELDLNRARQIEEDKNAIFFAMEANYPCILYVDLTSNICNAYIQEEIDLNIPIHGSYDNVFGVFREQLFDGCGQEACEEFAGKFSRRALTRHFLQTGDVVEMELFRRFPVGEHWLSIKAVKVSGNDSKKMMIVMTVSIIDIQKENERLSNLALQQSNEHLRRTLSKEEQYRQATLSGAILVYNINVSENLIEDEFFEIVDGKKIPMLAFMGMKAPCSFDEFSKAWRERNVATDDQEEFGRIYNRQYLLEAFARGEVEIMHEFLSKAGRGILIVFRQTILLIQDEETGNVIALCSVKDITVQREGERRARQALQEAYEAAKHANKAKSDFLSHMSHDMRTPLNAIIGMTAIAGMHLDERVQVENCLNKITTASEHLLALVNEVLDMSKIESGGLRLVEEKIDLSELVEHFLDMFRESINEKHHEFTMRLGQVEHEYVIGDSLRIQQVFTNLMSNAVKYTPEGGKIRLTITEKPSHTPSVGHYEFIFEDNGIGMTKEFIGKMFEPFTRAEDSRISKIQGTGLGMAITRTIVSMMGGNIRVESEPGKGSRFAVSIFLKLQNTDGISYDDFKNLHVLVTGGTQESCDNICCVLGDMGMDSEGVCEWERASEYIAAAHEEGKDFVAVLADMQEAGTDIARWISELRARLGKDTPAVMMIVEDLNDPDLETKIWGADELIGRPLFKSKLAALFGKVVGRGRKSDRHVNPLEVMKRADYSGYRALLAEDNELNAEIIDTILKMTGLTVEMAHNGKEALDMFEASEPGYYHIVFMDIQMPVMNGYEATRAIRSLQREDAAKIPIMAMTANAFAEDVQEAKDAGMNEHIAKPIDPKHLAAVMKRWLKA